MFKFEYIMDMKKILIIYVSLKLLNNRHPYSKYILYFNPTTNYL